MSDLPVSDSERDLLRVLKNEEAWAKENPSLTPMRQSLDASIAESEALLRSLGLGDGLGAAKAVSQPRARGTLVIRPFAELLEDAKRNQPDDIGFEDLFSAAEISANREFISRLNAEFDAMHRLDRLDVIIPVVAGILSGTVDCVLGGFSASDHGVNVPGTMTHVVRGLFDRVLPPETIRKLEELAKVPYDALNFDNRGNVIVQTIVEGLSPVFHHQVSLGHDPVLGFIFGTLDLFRGSVTTIGFDGKFRIQMAEGFSDRKAQGIFEALATVFLHMLSDVNGSSSAKHGGMGLPVPFMALFNKLQFGALRDNNTISELTKEMFYQGYDFRHFCAMSIPVMITEVIVRLSYFAKRRHEGQSIAEAAPVGLSHQKKPKLATMLFVGHSVSTAINAGKVAVTKSPLNINYAQWLAFTRYALSQLKWALKTKPALRDQYVHDAIGDDWYQLSLRMDALWDEFSSQASSSRAPQRGDHHR